MQHKVLKFSNYFHLFFNVLNFRTLLDDLKRENFLKMKEIYGNGNKKDIFRAKFFLKRLDESDLMKMRSPYAKPPFIILL